MQKTLIITFKWNIKIYIFKIKTVKFVINGLYIYISPKNLNFCIS